MEAQGKYQGSFRRRLGPLCIILALTMPASGQLNRQLYADYSKYQEKSIETRRFKHEDIMTAVNKLGKGFTVKTVGKSAEGRAIKLISWGSGPVNVLMWSQMHGDETTATRAILDVFRFIQSDDSYNEWRRRIQAGITWHFIPMLNPDGASRFTRRNRDGIDINRDALRLQTPEGRILKRVRDSLKAAWGFNLHDQGRGTSVNGKPATISLLAPPYNAAREINESRGDAMQLTRYLYNQIIEYIPGQIGIYPDDFEPRAFGDNMQKWGTRTVLIECGGYKDDWEKAEIRKLNFVLLLTGVEAITGKGYEQIPVEAYNEIPRNGDARILELIVRNMTYKGIVRDIAFDRREIDSEDFRRYQARGFISDMGDLSTSSSYFTFDAAGFDVVPGKVYEPALEQYADLRRLDLDALMKLGYTDFVIKGPVDRFDLPTKIQVHAQQAPTSQDIQIGANPSLIFMKNGAIEYVLVNGRLIKL